MQLEMSLCSGSDSILLVYFFSFLAAYKKLVCGPFTKSTTPATPVADLMILVVSFQIMFLWGVLSTEVVLAHHPGNASTLYALSLHGTSNHYLAMVTWVQWRTITSWSTCPAEDIKARPSEVLRLG